MVTNTEVFLMCIYTKCPNHENKISLCCRNLGSKNAEETLTRQCLWLTGWRPCIWNRLHTVDYLFPASKFYILDNKYPNFQSREPVRFRSRDDSRAGQSNIVVSRSPVQISESAHVCFFCFLWCFLRSRQLHLLEVRLTDFYSFFFHDHSCSKENRWNCREWKMVSIKMHYLPSLCKHKFYYVNMPM